MEGELHVDDYSVKGTIFQLYEKLYRENFIFRPFLEEISYSSVNQEDAGRWKKRFPRKKSGSP